jgi:hypothetical protein
MIYLQGSQPPVKALLLQNYGLNLTLILGLIAAITLSLDAIRVARDSNSRSWTIEGTSTSRPDRTSQRGHAQHTSTPPTFGQDSRSRSTSDPTCTEGARK